MRATALLLLFGAAGCAQPNSGTPVSGVKGSASQTTSRRGSSGRSSVGSGSNGSSTTSAVATTGSSSSAGTSSGSSGGASSVTSGSGSTTSSSSGSSGAAPPGTYLCGAIAEPPLATSCPTGGAFAAQAVDAFLCQAVSGATLSAIGTDGVPIAGASATSDATGAFAFCVPFATPFTVEAVAQTYLTTYFAELVLTEDGGLPVGQIGLIQQGYVGAFGSFVPGGYDAQLGLVVAVVKDSGSCLGHTSGWTISLALPDGGAIPDGGDAEIYLGSSGVPDPTATATSGQGSALFLNIEIPPTNYLLLSASNPNVGACPVQNPALGFTGRILVGANTGSLAPFLLP